jgi:hypothetical protein
VYKALEAMAYSLKNHPDAALEKKADQWIDKIAAAQEPDGYLNTYYSLMGLDQRWTDMEKHEDYCAGHLMEAAVAYYNTTGKRKLLEVAVRLADHMDATFRQQNRPWVSGHQEVELALVKLARTTGDKKYVELADWFLDQRGRGHGKGMIWSNPHMGPKYCQDDVPVRDQKEISGHAVRAMYLYTGAADVGAAKNDAGYMQAMKTVWEDVVYRNMYITGGIGSSGRNEGFSHDYDLAQRKCLLRNLRLGGHGVLEPAHEPADRRKQVRGRARAQSLQRRPGRIVAERRPFLLRQPHGLQRPVRPQRMVRHGLLSLQHLPPGGVAGRLRLRQIRQCHLGQPVRGQQHHHSP